MTAKPLSGLSILLPASLAAIALGAWWWQAAVHRARRAELPQESWEHVKQDYPMSEEAGAPPKVSLQIAESVVRANPFSPKRRLPPPQASGATGSDGGGGVQPLAPKFVYKGRIHLGKRQRAIVEEMTTHKTYFLELGQEVAEFKVLDITENRVVLSNLKTNEETVLSLTATPSP